MAKLNLNEMAAQIIAGLGGKDNLSQLNHCATRLRVGVKDPAKVNVAVLKKIPGVLGVELTNDQSQVIVGQIIEDLFLEVEKQAGKISGSEGKKKNGKVFSSFLLMMAGILSPVIPALIAAGFLSTLLTIMTLVFGIDSTNSTYQILYNLSQTVFYFLPVFVAYTSAKKFDTEPVLAMMLACFLLYPDWVSAAAEGGFTSYFGLPVLRVTYNGAVIQIILSVFIMAKLDRLLKKIIPEVVRHFLKPFVLILLMSVITLVVTGPLGGFVTNYIAIGVDAVRNVAPWAGVPAIILFATTIGLVAPGFHLALIPIAFTNLATVGYDDLINIWFFCCTITPGFIALAVALRTKNNNCRQIAIPAFLSALLGGISEPTTYGIEMKMVKPYYAFVFTAFTTSILAGLMHLKCYGFGGYSLTNILLYLGPDLDYANFRNALICVAYMAVMSFVSVNVLGFDDSVYDDDTDEIPALKGSVSLGLPAQGELVAQANLKDATFAQGVLGACFGVKPAEPTVLSPVNGKVTHVASTGHAISLLSDEGAEVLVHIGIDSVNLDGKGLTPLVKVGQTVKLGEKIATYDKEVFRQASLDDTVICVLMNTDDYKSVTSTAVSPLTATV